LLETSVQVSWIEALDRVVALRLVGAAGALPPVKVPEKVVVPEQGPPGPDHDQLLVPLKVLPDTVAVSEVMVVVPPSSG